MKSDREQVLEIAKTVAGAIMSNMELLDEIAQLISGRRQSRQVYLESDLPEIVNRVSDVAYLVGRTMVERR